MEINNSAYGGFLVSKNIVSGKPVKYTFREKSTMQQLNGWNLYSVDDDDAYVKDSKNFVILSAESISKIAPVILELFDAPYGTDLCWLYTDGVHTGFYDLKANRETTIREIIEAK